MAVALDMRTRGLRQNDLVERLANDSRVPLGRGDLAALLDNPLEFTGSARAQVQSFVARVEGVCRKYPEAASYRGEPIL